MKNMKKILALVIAALMLVSMTAALAETQTTPATSIPVSVGTATAVITAPSTAHQYEVYQIFAGDLDNGVLSNVVWGVNSANRGTGVNVGDKVADTVLTALEGISSTATDATKLATIDDYVDLNSNPVAIITNGGTTTVPTGYYLIKDVDGSVTGDDAYTQYIVQVTGSFTITPKADVPSSEKKVKDKADSASTVESDWADSADYDIGDEINYKITATIPATVRLDDFETYKLNFIDTMSAGLTYKANSAVVKVDGTQVAALEPTSEDYSGSESAYTGGHVLTWSIANIKASPYNVTTQGTAHTVVIEYVATLNDSAVKGTAGNPNKMHIEFSNNPHSTEDKGETTDDINIVFTYDLLVNKLDQDQQPLANAHFALYKKYTTVPSGKSTVTTATYNNGNSTYTFTGANWVLVKELTTGTTFSFEGIDDGEYVLIETATPSGYNSVDPYEFTITAVHQDGDNPTLVSLNDITADSPSTKVNLGTLEATVNLPAGSFNADVVNNQGTTLPSTGGMGTTILYIGGSILVILAAILLITKRRMGSED